MTEDQATQILKEATSAIWRAADLLGNKQCRKCNEHPAECDPHQDGLYELSDARLMLDDLCGMLEEEAQEKEERKRLKLEILEGQARELRERKESSEF